MVLLVDGKEVCDIDHINDLYEKYPSIKHSAHIFSSQALTTINSKSALYVGQGEFAVVSALDKSLSYVGSDEATSCHVLILKSTSGTVAVTHLDGRKKMKGVICQMLSDMFGQEKNWNKVDVFVIGGYNPGLNIKDYSQSEFKDSQNISLRLLNIFSKLKIEFSIRLCCTCDQNTIFNGKLCIPKVYGIAIDLCTHSVFPATFADQEPNITLRAATQWVSKSTNSYFRIYDTPSCTVVIDPVEEWTSEPFNLYCQLPDIAILKYFSNSPQVEPSNFCNSMRKKYTLLASTSAKVQFPNGQPRKFKVNNAGVWEEITN